MTSEVCPTAVMISRICRKLNATPSSTARAISPRPCVIARPTKRPAGQRVPVRAALAQQIRQEQQIATARWRLAGGFIQSLVLRLRLVVAAHQALEPVKRAAGGLHRAQCHVQTRIEMDEIERALQRIKDRLPGTERQPGGGSNVVVRISSPHRTGAHRGARTIAPADHHRRAGLQSAARGRLMPSPADHLGRGINRRSKARIKPQPLQQRLRPSPCPKSNIRVSEASEKSVAITPVKRNAA